MIFSPEFLPNIEDLPLILAGPILRRTESDAVTVWLALKQSRFVTLKIYATEKGQGDTPTQEVARGEAHTIELGKNLHLIALTAQTFPNNYLQPNHIYAYNLFFNDGEENLITVLSKDESISYFSHQLPTFCLPPENINDLRIIHGSCRKPHGGGEDALSFLDDLIQSSAHLPNDRPQQLFLTGDQIYGDDVADIFLSLTQKISFLLLDWDEDLPLISGKIKASELLPGNRSEIACIEAGFTAMLNNHPEKAKSHLFSFGEYAVAYLLSWSPVLIPKQLSNFKKSLKNSNLSKNCQQEFKSITNFFKQLSSVRRALANIPTYTICDDHDLSDDWYLNRQWCDRVLSKPLGRRVVQNGLLAYSLFQAWGNTPSQFGIGSSGEKLLGWAVEWLSSQGKNTIAEKQLNRYLGIPSISNATGLPEVELDENVLILRRDKQALSWHYNIRSSKHEVIVLDTRTWRGYPVADETGLGLPMLLSPTAFSQQLEIPLEETKAIELTIVVLPSNLVTLNPIDVIQKWHINRDKVFSSDVGDSWNFHQEAFSRLLLTLTEKRGRIIILSGDIHYSCAVRLNFSFSSTGKNSTIIQLTSSPLKNSEFITQIIHSKLKSLLPESPEHWLGWNSLKTKKLSQPNWWQSIFLAKQNKQQRIKQIASADWQYTIEWIKREQAKSLPWRQRLVKSEEKISFARRIIEILLIFFWRNRWLQEGKEVVGRNNLSLVRFQWSSSHQVAVIQETYWHPPWNPNIKVKSIYFIDI